MKLTLYFLFIFFMNSSFAGTLLSNTGAFFAKSDVFVRVSSNSTCVNAGITKSEIINLITPSINNYWNTVSGSRLTLFNGKEFTTQDASFVDGVLCSDRSIEVGCTGVTDPIPPVEDILITCNKNLANYSIGGLDPKEVLAITLPNNITGSTFLGSVILINDTVNSPFKTLTNAEQEAVIAHEIGHAIGIGHSPNDANLMFWTPTPERFSLGPDDVDSLLYLYPKKFDGCGLISSVDDKASKNPFSSYPFQFFVTGFFLLLFHFSMSSVKAYMQKIYAL